MKYFKIEDDKYILGVYAGHSGVNQITREEYDLITETFKNAPKLEEGMGCGLLKDTLEWEVFVIPYAEENEDDAEGGTS